MISVLFILTSTASQTQRLRRRKHGECGCLPQGRRKAFPFRITHLLADRGSCFATDNFERGCAKIKVSHRTTPPYTPQANNMVSGSMAASPARCLTSMPLTTPISKSC